MAERVYRTLRARTRWLTWLLYGWLAFSLLEAIPRLALLLQAEGVAIDAGLVGGEQFATLMEAFGALFLIACGVAYCFWIYCANSNLHAFGKDDIHSPGWAVGVNFIPIVSLWMGYQVMREVWDKSGPPDSDLDGRGWLLPIWWGAWIVTNIASTLLWRVESWLSPMTRLVCEFVAPAVSLIAGVALVAIVAKIDIAQQQQDSLEVF